MVKLQNPVQRNLYKEIPHAVQFMEHQLQLWRFTFRSGIHARKRIQNINGNFAEVW